MAVKVEGRERAAAMIRQRQNPRGDDGDAFAFETFDPRQDQAPRDMAELKSQRAESLVLCEQDAVLRAGGAQDIRVLGAASRFRRGSNICAGRTSAPAARSARTTRTSKHSSA
jgi:hypothetical protein